MSSWRLNGRISKSGSAPLSDKIFRLGATIAGVYVLAIIVIMVIQLGIESGPIWEESGLGFIIGTDWNPAEGRESFGALPYVLGTLITSAIAMAIAVAMAMAMALARPTSCVASCSHHF